MISYVLPKLRTENTDKLDYLTSQVRLSLPDYIPAVHGSDAVGAVHLPHQEAGQAPAEDPGQQHHLRAVT